MSHPSAEVSTPEVTRRRIRIGIVVYALSLLALLLVGAYAAPAAALDAPVAPNGTVEQGAPAQIR
jgi:hypothetical protein